MNPIEIKADIRELDLMLYGGTPLRPDADFGRGEVGHVESAKARSPEVRIITHNMDRTPRIIVERRILTKEGEMVAEGLG